MVLGAFAYTFDGVYIGVTLARDMRNLMLTAFALYLAARWVLQSYGNAGLWPALLVLLAVRNALQSRCPALEHFQFELTRIRLVRSRASPPARGQAREPSGHLLR